MEKQLELVASSSVDGEMAEYISEPENRRKGGFITMPFIIANEALAKVATLGLLPNMILYLMGSYNMHLGLATQILLLSSAANNITPLIGAFVADSYLGRFQAVGLGSLVLFLGMGMLWLTAMFPAARPPACSHTASEICKSATGGQMTMLVSAYALMSIGNGGLSCSMPFGADQVNRKDNPNNSKVLETFFTWYYASTTLAVIIALTVIVYIQDHLGWKIGFGVPAALMLLATLFFLFASPLYVKHKVQTSLLTGFAQVISAAFKNRKLSLPPNNSPELYHHKKGSDLLLPTHKIRCLNKACVIKDPEQDISPDGLAIDPWSLCTIEQVEELKALIKVIPLWSSGIMMSLSIGGSFGLLQAKSLDRNIGHFQIPAGSFAVILVATIFLWIALYDRAILPLMSKIRGKQVRISPKTRMGIGLFFNTLHLLTAGIVENIRRNKAIKEGYINDTHGILKMSAMWLAPQLVLAGIAEAFNAIGQSEFYYREFPSSMSSVAGSLFGLGMAAGNLLSSFVFSTIESVTSKGGKDGWITDNINKGRFDKYYWVLAGLSALNILYYLLCSWAYGPPLDLVSKTVTEENENKEGESTEFKNGDHLHLVDRVNEESGSKERELNGGQVDKVFKNISEENGSKEEEILSQSRTNEVQKMEGSLELKKINSQKLSG